MMSEKKIKLKIIAPEKVVFDEEVDAFYTRGINGEFGILPDHVPFMSALDIGVTKIIQGDKDKYITTLGGFFQLKENEAVILTNNAERGEDIDVLRAKDAKARAEARLAKNSDAIDTARASMAIAKALARLKAALKENG